MPTPTPVIDPSERKPADVLDAATYHPKDLVWVWPPRDGNWRPGVVDAASDQAALVTFYGPGGGTGVDTLLPRYVMPRAERVDGVDNAVPDRRLPARPRTTPTTVVGALALGATSLLPA